MSETLFEKIGEEKMREIIEAFYIKAFSDSMISHFFFNKDREHLTKMQFLFTASNFGSKAHQYPGKPMKLAHTGLPFKNVHFDRRKVLMLESMKEAGLSEDLSDAWIYMEEKFRKLIVSDSSGCMD